MSPTQTAAPDISPSELRGAMGRFASGVTVVTSRDEAGRPCGTTVSAVSSLSLDPPLILACLDRRSQTLAAVHGHGAFAVNVLGRHHEEVSNAFARSANHAAWDDLAFSEAVTGSPLLGDAHVALDCRVEQRIDGGDHEVLLGRVVAVRHPDDESAPLVYYAGRYAGIAEPTLQERAEREVRDRAEREAVECNLPTKNGVFRLLAHERTGGDVTAALVYGDPRSHPSPLVHAHEACLLGDVLGSLACDCGGRLQAAQQAIQDAGAGVLLYTRRSQADSFLCSAGSGPDLTVGAGLLAHLGVGRAAAALPGDPVAGDLLRALKTNPTSRNEPS